MPVVGDAVRVRMQGTITAMNGGTATVTTQDGTAVVFPTAADRGIRFEVIAAPEPIYIAGECYRDAAGGTFLRNNTDFPGDAWIVVKHPDLPKCGYVHNDTPIRPLKRLVPEP